jgi:hypothetical protein
LSEHRWPLAGCKALCWAVADMLAGAVAVIVGRGQQVAMLAAVLEL